MNYLTMKEVCEKTGITYDTLKFYCNEGLVPGVKRDSNNHRIFDEPTLDWVNHLSCLRNCNMGIAEMKRFVELVLKGKSTVSVRKELLEEKKGELLRERAAIDEAIDYVDYKQEFYDKVLSGEIDYDDYVSI